MTGTNAQSDPLTLPVPARRGLWAAARAAGRLLGNFRGGSSQSQPSPADVPAFVVELAMDEPAVDPAALLVTAADMVSTLRMHFSEISRAPTPTQRELVLVEILKQAEALKALTMVPELDSILQMAAALHGMLVSIKEKNAAMTPAVLRTLAAAVALMEALCIPGRRADLYDPPVKLLAVDDDPISRIAVTVALKKVFSQPPDLVSFPRVGLELAASQKYDIIFLDIEMPEMSGFELCSQIQQTEFNRTTPILFVTTHGEPEARAMSSSLGAQALVPKPFMSFELALRALTLVLRARLDDGVKATPAFATAGTGEVATSTAAISAPSEVSTVKS